ncbi:MAG: histidine--tRNA ligase [Actinomycetota bacterium]
MAKFEAPRGAPDILPPRAKVHRRVVRTAEDLFARYGYRPIEPPIFEVTEVFERGLEAGSDIVTKEMYTFTDKGGRSLTLRPEATASVVRAVLEHGLDRGALPVKLSYSGPMFRHERPQAGRQRQFTQVGVEALGSPGPDIDAEVVELASAVLRDAGLDTTLQLNSIGHPACRAAYLPRLVAYLEANRERLCADCRRKIETNPLRTFDCRVPGDREVLRGAPLISDHLCDECREHFDAVQGLLKDGGVDFRLEPRLVRGLDYYTRTTFAYLAEGLGAQNEVGGGGRYDGLSEQLGGGPLPGIGFALGIDRIALALEAEGEETATGLDVYVASVGEEARRRAFVIATDLRRRGLACDLDLDGRGLRTQLKAADRAGARHAVVVGERDLAEGGVTVRDMASGREERVPVDALAAHLEAHWTRAR